MIVTQALLAIMTLIVLLAKDALGSFVLIPKTFVSIIPCVMTTNIAPILDAILLNKLVRPVPRIMNANDGMLIVIATRMRIGKMEEFLT